MSGYAVEQVNSVEVVAAWTVPPTVVTGRESAALWTSCGEYFLPKSVMATQLELVGIVSTPGLVLRLRLWDTTANQAINGAAETESTAPVRVLGGKVDLTGNRTYQVQAQCVITGEFEIGEGDAVFGVVTSATITD